ncbi:hypothetical protein HWV62_32565 [Athelia sp. TMB]|nr:hypothetical protein HWV62_32565 [Athelia sp. TMB]
MKEQPPVFDHIWQSEDIMWNIHDWLPRRDSQSLARTSKQFDDWFGTSHYDVVKGWCREFLGLLPSDEVRPTSSPRCAVSDDAWMTPQYPHFWARFVRRAGIVAAWCDEATPDNYSTLFYTARAYRATHPTYHTTPFKMIVYLKLTTGNLTHFDIDCLQLMSTLMHVDFGRCSVTLPAHRQTALMDALQQLPRLGSAHMEHMDGYVLTPSVFGAVRRGAFPSFFQVTLRATWAGATSFLNCLPAQGLNDLTWAVEPTIGEGQAAPQFFHARFWQTLHRKAGTSLDTLTLKFPEDARWGETTNNGASWAPRLRDLTTISIYGPPQHSLVSFINPIHLGRLRQVYHDRFTWDSLPQMNDPLRLHCRVTQLEFGTITPNYARADRPSHLVDQRAAFVTQNLPDVAHVVILRSMVPGVDASGNPLPAPQVASVLLEAFPALERVLFKKRQERQLEEHLAQALGQVTGITYRGLDVEEHEEDI